MFSTRNGQAAPGVKNFGMQGPSKGFSGVRVFKGPTLSSFNLNPFSTVSAHFDSFDVGYRPSQPDLPQRHGGHPPRNQQQPSRNWQAHNNMYIPSNAPPPPPSHTYQQNPMAHFGVRTASQSSGSRSQEPPRHRDVQPQPQPTPLNHNYFIHPGKSTDMYIYEASDAFSEYSPSTFSPTLSTDSTTTLQSPSPSPLGQSGLSWDHARSATPSLRPNAPAPPSGQSRAQSPQSYPSNSYPSNSGNGGISFPSSLPGIRQAQTALRGFFGSNGQVGQPGERQSGESTQNQGATNDRTHSRTLSESSSTVNALPNSETEFDDLARMNTALNAGYSYYYPETPASVRPRSGSTSISNSASQRSPRDSLMFYSDVQRVEQSPETDLNFPYSQTAPTVNIRGTSDKVPSSTLEMSGAAVEISEASNTPQHGTSLLVPALERSISSSSQSSELSILRTPSPTSYPSSQLPSSLQSQPQTFPYPTVQSKPVEQVSTTVPPAYTTYLSASPEPQISPSSLVQVQSSPALLSSSRSQSQSSSTSSSASDTLNGSHSEAHSSFNRDRGVAHPATGEGIASNSPSAVAVTSPNQAYPMPHVALTETRSFNNTTLAPLADPLNISQSGRTRSPTTGRHGDSRNVMGPATDNGEARRGGPSDNNDSCVRTRKSSTTTRSPNSSPPRIYGQPTTDSQRANAPPRFSLPTSTTPAPPQQVQTRVRKDSMSLGMKSSSSSRLMSRSNPSATPSYPSSNTVNREANSGRFASSPTAETSFSIGPSNPLSTSAMPSSFPEPRRSHSDGDNPSLTAATRRSAVPFQTEFVPAVSSSASAIGSHSNRDFSRDTLSQPAFENNHRPDPARMHSSELPSRPASVNPRPAAETLRSRSVRWNEALICPSPIWPSQRRKGWFNRRGDQLWTNGGAFRSPPGGEEYPLDLDGYPDFGEGWMNEEGTRIDMAHRLIPKAPLRSALKTKARAN
ncbi:hypothetical protein F5876DRAFT_73925 [Lentinula aff. lateritia]|uniref:Uncharacterized protein n=1 Tax=Lentinula aff. lateritia TaxID=2804960 RepID=A0ACC1U8G3_9AGAR|nr:hypothetical protein F5876DRAFT_73925 [Lentinula aff. lateritia]